MRLICKRLVDNCPDVKIVCKLAAKNIVKPYISESDLPVLTLEHTEDFKSTVLTILLGPYRKTKKGGGETKEQEESEQPEQPKRLTAKDMLYDSKDPMTTDGSDNKGESSGKKRCAAKNGKRSGKKRKSAAVVDDD